MGTHPIFESDFDCLTALKMLRSGSIKTAARQASQYVDLSSWRSLIAVKGRDAFPLLQGVTTNDICNLEHVKCSYSMLLNSKGRIMFDVLLYHKSPDEILVECDLALSEKVRKHLSMYKVRRKVKLGDDANILVTAPDWWKRG